MGLFMWILIFSTLALAKCSFLENTNAELVELKKLFSQLMVKQNDMEKEMKQMRIKNEAMEVQISQLQFAYRQERRYHYNSNKAVEKQLHEVQQQNNNLRILISDLQAKQNESETTVKSAALSNGQIRCCEKEPRPIQKPMMKQFLGHTDNRSRNNIANYKLSTANGSSDMPLHKNTTNSYLEKQNVEDKTVAKDKPKRLLIPATGIPDTSKTVVAFQARPSHHISNLGDNQHMEFDSVIFSEGPGYDKITGTFQCVVPGVYVFSVTLLAFPNKYVEATIVRNGNPLAYIYGYGDDLYNSGTNMAVVRLEAGDKVWVRVNGDYHHSGTTLYSSFTTFTGFLLQS